MKCGGWVKHIVWGQYAIHLKGVMSVPFNTYSITQIAGFVKLKGG